VREEVKALVTGTFLDGAPVVELSARTGQGVPVLIEEMDRMLDHLPGLQDDAPARLPIDRAFTMAGFGTVVTGTLWSGRIALGDTLEILPQGRVVRVRGVQSHGQGVGAGIAGSRVAVNLTGVEKDEVGRGDVLSTLGAFRPTNLIDVRVQLLAASPMLPHLARIRIYVGADEAIGRLVLLDRSRIEPADSATAQIRLEKPIVVAAGDPFVIRRYSPMTTVGGGEIVSVHPPKRRRGADSVVAIDHLSAAGLPERLAAAVLDAGKHGTTAEEVMKQLSVGRTQLDATLPALGNRGQVMFIRGRLFHRHVADAIAGAIVREVEARHEAEPWRVGIPKDELKAKAFGTGDNHLYAHVLSELIAAGKVDETGNFVRRPGYAPPVDPKVAGARDRILRVLLEGRFAPPGVDEIAKGAGEGTAFDRLFRTLRDEGVVVEIGSGVFFHRDVLEEIKHIVADEIRARGNITVGTLRDKLGTSRKYSLSVLEYFDSIKMTRRVGDTRVLLARAASSEK
jgi:selenocysteine-specific elongation factor